MVQIKKHRLIITVNTDNPQIYLNKLRKALTEVTAILVESDEFYYNGELPDALATLIRLNGKLDSDSR